MSQEDFQQQVLRKFEEYKGFQKQVLQALKKSTNALPSLKPTLKKLASKLTHTKGRQLKRLSSILCKV